MIPRRRKSIETEALLLKSTEIIKQLAAANQEMVERVEALIKRMETPKTISDLIEEVDQLSAEDRIQLGNYCLSK